MQQFHAVNAPNLIVSTKTATAKRSSTVGSPTSDSSLSSNNSENTSSLKTISTTGGHTWTILTNIVPKPHNKIISKTAQKMP